MAVVMERRFGNAIVRVDDADIESCPEEAMRRRREQVGVAVRAILANPTARRALIEKYRKEDGESEAT